VIGKALASPASSNYWIWSARVSATWKIWRLKPASRSQTPASIFRYSVKQNWLEVHQEGKFSYYRLAAKEAFRTWQSIRDFAAVKVAEVQRLVEQYLNRPDRLEAISIAEQRRRLAMDDVVLINVVRTWNIGRRTFQARYPCRWKACNRPAHTFA
jgi:hypothetical protein